VLILAFNGVRWGEAIALTVADVEFLRRRISVHRNAVQVGQTKGKENRTVPVAASVLSRLAVRCICASLGVSSGANVLAVSRMLGQRSQRHVEDLCRSLR
jgi:integrase